MDNNDEGPCHKKKKVVRVWVDGCFDFTHFGHANFLRQAKSFGDYLIVGIHSDEEIARFKGPPVMPEQERYKMVRAIKWVDEVAEDVPYLTTLDIMDKYNCDICVHGDDIAVDQNGQDVYLGIKRAGRYRECPRTHGVSSTKLIQRILEITTTEKESNVEDRYIHSPFTGISPYLSTGLKISQFCTNRPITKEDKVVYCPGFFDLYHGGHIDFLRTSKAQGTYLLVGLYSDDVVYYCKGQNRPILNLQERAMTCLSCRYVDDVVIGAPYAITHDLLDHFQVKVVAHGKTPVMPTKEGTDPFAVAKARGIYQQVDSGSSMSDNHVIERIGEHKGEYEKRNRAKASKELAAIRRSTST